MRVAYYTTCNVCSCLIFSSALLLLVTVANSKVNATIPREFVVADPSPPKRPSWNATWTDMLKRDLLHNYDKFARPAQHNTTTTVTMHMTFRHIDLSWTDEKLKWNASDYGDLSVLHIADHEIWQPDIVLYNSATGSTIDHYGNTHCIAYPNGNVLWVPPTQFLVFCELDLRLWPFDTQTCYMRLGSWTYDGDQVDIQIDEHGSEVNPVYGIIEGVGALIRLADTTEAIRVVPDTAASFQVELMDTNAEWELVDVEEARNIKKYACCEEPYIDITYNVTLRRQSPTYNAIVITPATVIVLMTLSNFWLPPQAGEKIMLGGCTAIIICIFLVYFSQKMPAMASHTPLVVLFYSSSLYMVCLSLIVSVVVLNLSRSKNKSALPWVLKNVLTGWLGRILGLGHIISQVHQAMMSGHAEELREQQAGFEDHNDDHQMIPRETKSGSQYDWILLAAAIDRIMFLVYCLLFIILAIAYSI
uniref:Uncharacterized protein n=2 Tax=Timema TaxID=61471 RepID=A0A7R9AXH7_TIMSH|nr:unnamed protein product [Timema shepardi]